MKIAVIYATRTGHSKKLAEAIGSFLHVEASDMKGNPALHDIDLLFITGGIYGGACMPELLEYLKNTEMSPTGCAALVTSCASGRQRQTAVRRILEEKGIKVIDEFVCRGSILFVSLNHPGAGDLKDAAGFAQKVVSAMTQSG